VWSAPAGCGVYGVYYAFLGGLEFFRLVFDRGTMPHICTFYIVLCVYVYIVYKESIMIL